LSNTKQDVTEISENQNNENTTIQQEKTEPNVYDDNEENLNDIKGSEKQSEKETKNESKLEASSSSPHPPPLKEIPPSPSPSPPPPPTGPPILPNKVKSRTGTVAVFFF
jgi:hypothetical protein